MTDVVHIITGLGMGGAETSLVQLAAALRARGLSQHVVSLTSLDARAEDVRAAGIGVTMLSGDKALRLPGALWTLVRTVNRLRPRIIQGWMYHGNLAASLCHAVLPGRGARRLFWNLRASNRDETRYGRLLRFSARVSPPVDVTIANSQAGETFHRGLGFRPKSFIVIGNGIDADKFRPDAALRDTVRAELGLAADAVVALHVARVDPMKDHQGFLDAVTRLPALTGVMAGRGTELLSAPPNVRGLGQRSDAPRLAAAADIVVSSSAFGEGFSNALAEGMSAGLLPVATDVGDARHIVDDTGFVVPPRDPGALSAALAAAASLSPGERRARGLAARERIRAHFTLDAVTDRYAALYAANAAGEEG